MSVQWTPEESSYIENNTNLSVHTLFVGLLERYIAKVPGFNVTRSKEAIRKKIRFFQNDFGHIHPGVDLGTIQKIQKDYYEGIDHTPPNLFPRGDVSRVIVSMSDIHFPFARIDILEHILNTETDMTDIVLNGDIFDGYAHSSYPKEISVNPIDEYQCVFSFVQTLVGMKKKIHLVEGNHDDRFLRYLNKLGLFDNNTLKLISSNLLQRIADGVELDSKGRVVAVHDWSEYISFRELETWWTLIGKTLFIHPSTRMGANPGHTVLNWNQQFSNRFHNGEYDSIVCGHTHLIYKGIIGGKLLIEQGCLAGFQRYGWNKKDLSNIKAMNGYAKIYQDKNGNTQFNMSQPKFMGYVSPTPV